MKKTRTIKCGTLYRTFVLQREAVNAESRTVEMSCSSDNPVERWWGQEILDHSAGSVRMDRMKSCGPLLMDHNTRDQIGVVESCKLESGRLMATVRFGKSGRAEEVFQDVLDGIRSNVSIGYMVHRFRCDQEEEIDKNGRTVKPAIYRAIDWEPFEVSLVSVPADTSVGVGRSESEREVEIEIETTHTEVRTMKCTRCGQELVNGACSCGHREAIIPQAANPAPTAVDVNAIRTQALSDVREILAIAARRPDILMAEAQQFIANGRSLDEFRSHVMERLFNAQPVQVTSEIGLTESETREYSFLRAIHALANPSDLRARDAAGFEFECSRAVAGRVRKEPQGFFVPMDVQRRDLTKGTQADGGYSVQTSVIGGSFIELLRNKLCLQQMGSTILTGLVGDIAIPSQTGAATAYWVAENTAPTESQQVLGQVAMNPKTVGAYTDISRKLLLQSSIDVEQMVRNDLAAIIALAIDYAGINGSGTSNQPRGILNTSGIGSVAGGTNGAAPTWANIIALETAVATLNADVGKLGYCTNTKVRGTLKTTQKATYLPFIWENGDAPGEGILNGYRACATNQVPSNLTKGTSSGVCSAIIYGNFADWIIALWGALDILVDPYTGGAAGTVRVRMLQDVDHACRRVASFAAMLDALTP